jgi:regulator of cell morphogenesis and NO signaling
MSLITSDMKMADVIHGNYLLIPIINRFGIHLGFGEKTVKAVCSDYQIDHEFFLTIINTFSNENYFPEKKLQTFNVLLILAYLRKTHNYYLDVQIPLIERHIDALINVSSKHPNLELVKNFFLTYKKELRVHISREEAITFPYIEKIYALYHHTFDATLYHEISSSYSIKKFDEEHDNIDDKLYDLQNILIKYVTGDFDQTLINTIIFELFRLEKDIKDHTRLEDKVLIPLIVEIENGLKLKNT